MNPILSLVASVVGFKDVIAILHDNLEDELKSKFDSFQLVASVKEETCFFRVDRGLGLKRIPWADGKEVYGQLKDVAKQYVPEGMVLDYAVMKYTQTKIQKPGLLWGVNDERKVDLEFDIYGMLDGKQECFNHIVE